jgi:hypothetical protein
VGGVRAGSRFIMLSFCSRRPGCASTSGTTVSNFSPECPLDASLAQRRFGLPRVERVKAFGESGEGLLDLRFAAWEQSTADVRYYW